MSNNHKPINWDALKLEWLQTDLSPHGFITTKGIDPSHFSKSVDINDWKKTRHEIHQKALTKLVNRQSTVIADRYSDFKQLWKGVKHLSAKILKQMIDSKRISPDHVVQLANAIDKAMRGTMVLDGNAPDVNHIVIQLSGIINSRIGESCPHCGKGLDFKTNIVHDLEYLRDSGSSQISGNTEEENGEENSQS